MYTTSINSGPPRRYSISDGERTLTWYATQPHRAQLTEDDGSDAWLEEAANDAARVYTDMVLPHVEFMGLKERLAAVEYELLLQPWGDEE